MYTLFNHEKNYNNKYNSTIIDMLIFNLELE